MESSAETCPAFFIYSSIILGVRSPIFHFFICLALPLSILKAVSTLSCESHEGRLFVNAVRF